MKYSFQELLNEQNISISTFDAGSLSLLADGKRAEQASGTDQNSDTKPFLEIEGHELRWDYYAI